MLATATDTGPAGAAAGRIRLTAARAVAVLPCSEGDLGGPVTVLPASVDRDILDHQIMHAVRTIREAFGCSIPGAIDGVSARYEVLRRERPNDFTYPHEEFGRGFHS